MSTTWAIATLTLTIATLTRLALLIWAAADVPVALWPGIFARGLWFDLATLGFALAPVLSFRALLPDPLRHHHIYRNVRWLALWALLAVLIFVALAEATFWLEFSTRFNFIAVDYLIYTQEVIGNIRESYPVNGLLGGIAVIAATALWLLRKRLALAPAVTGARTRLALVLLAALLPTLSYRFADADQMRWSGNAFADELSGNGVFTFFAAARRNDLDYARFYATLPQARADVILAALGMHRPPLSGTVISATAPASSITVASRMIILIKGGFRYS